MDPTANTYKKNTNVTKVLPFNLKPWSNDTIKNICM